MDKMTLEEKERFFALYWKQEVACDDGFNQEDNGYEVNAGTISGHGLLKIDYLLLTPLFMITKEHAIEVLILSGYGENNSVINPIQIALEELEGADQLRNVADYLRANEYAVPRTNSEGKTYTVEEMVSQGIIKLREE